MAIPDFQTLMLPLLRHLGDGKEHSNQETLDALTKEFGLSEAELAQLLPSGTQGLFRNRVAWAKAHFKKAGLVESPRRSVYKISPAGLDVLARRVKECPPDFFERLVVELLLAMGYGGSRQDAGQAVGRSGDGGIDGIIKEDKLGLDTIYIQAKRWDGTVSRPEIQKFAGALQGQRARKGIFLTTSAFSKEARDFAASIDSKIILLDGETLANLMIDHGIGVTDVATYAVKRVDSDYFSQE
jgi:restriction system protein